MPSILGWMLIQQRSPSRFWIPLASCDGGHSRDEDRAEIHETPIPIVLQAQMSKMSIFSRIPTQQRRAERFRRKCAIRVGHQIIGVTPLKCFARRDGR